MITDFILKWMLLDIPIDENLQNLNITVTFTEIQGVHEMVLRFPLAVAQYKMIPQSFFLYQ